MKLASLLASLLLSALPVCGGGLSIYWDFENGKGAWSPWGVKEGELADAEVKQIAIVSESSPHGGKACLEVKDSFDKANPYLSLGDAIAIDPSKVYCFSGWIRSSGKQSLPASVALAAESDGVFINWLDSIQIPTTSDWQEFKIVTSKIPKGAKQLRPAIFLFTDKDPKSSVGGICLDDLKFNEQSFDCADFSKAANRPFKDDPSSGKPGWTSQGNNDLRGMKSGPASFGNVPFLILDPEANGGNGVLALSSKEGFAKEGSVSFKGPKPCDWVYILNTAAWARNGVKAGTATFNYADGSSAKVEIVAGQHVGDWWNGAASEAFSASLEGVCPQKDSVYLFISALKNPKPGQPLSSISFKASSNESLIWLLLGATLGSGPNMIESSVVASRDYSKWFNFDIKNRKTSNAIVNLASLLDAPAGKHGFLKTGKDGHFVFADGTPVRFWGTNLHSGNTIFPTKDEAEAVADTLARYGVNLVRLHLTEYLLIDTSFPDRSHFLSDEQKLDRFDYYLKCFKDRGIYILLDSVSGLSARDLTAADGVSDYKDYFSHRPWAYYDPRLKELGRKYMKDYLTHVNKYTGKALVDEPGVAMIMVINEQSAFFDWGSKKESKAVPEHYQRILAKLFSEWLLKAYGSKEALAKAWTDEKGVCALLPSESLESGSVAVVKCDDLGLGDGKQASVNAPVRVKDSIRFLYDLQTAYYKETKDYLLSLGVKVPIAGTNIVYDAPELKTHLAMDYTSQNEYFDHPKYGAKEGLLSMRNTPLTKVNPLNGRLVEHSIAAVKVASMPCTSTESDATWPHEWRASHLFSLASTSALQDWDAIFHYAYMGGWGYDWSVAERTKTVLNPTVEFNDPAVMGTFPAAALIRRDLASSKSVVRVVFSDKDLVSQTGYLKNSCFPFNYLSYVSKVEGSFDGSCGDVAASVSSGSLQGRNVFEFEKSKGASAKEELAKSLDSFLKERGVLGSKAGLQDGALVSDTGEIVRDWKSGRISVNSPRSQGLTGFPGPAPHKFKDLEISSGSLFATLVVNSLDGQPLASSKKAFLTAVGRAENDKDKISYARVVKEPFGSRGEHMILEKGNGGKIMTEIINSEIKLKAASVKMTPLAPDMSAAAPPTLFKAVDGVVTVVTGEGTPSIWYLLEIER